MIVPHTAPTGRLMRKHHLQVVELAMAPPTRGPEAAAIAHVAPIPEAHFARSLSRQSQCGPMYTAGRLYLP